MSLKMKIFVKILVIVYLYIPHKKSPNKKIVGLYIYFLSIHLAAVFS